jgi:predicted metalloprotease
MVSLTSRIAGAATLLAGIALIAGCTSPVAGTAAVNRPDPAKVAGLDITTGPSGPKAGVQDAGLPVRNGDGGAIDRLAVNAVADVQQYWSEQLPANFDQKYQPVRQLTSYESSGPALELCRTSTAGLVNAFYCSADDSVAWDRAELLPMLNDSFGPMAVVTVLAHELGHAVQFRLAAAGLADQAAPSIVKEQQADCYAGNFFRWVAEGKSPHFQVSTGPGLNQIMATLFFIRDSAGSSFDSEGAHGSAFDRVSAFQFGFDEGPKRCAKIDAAEVAARSTQTEFSPNEQDSGLGKGNLRVDDTDALLNLEKTLRDAFQPTGAQPPTMSVRAANCTDAKRTLPAAYCPGTNVVTLDTAALVKIGSPPRRGTTGGIGDFAAFAEIASRYTLSVQKAAGSSLDGLATGQLTACLTGSWAGTITPGKNPALELSPGDLDEAIAELLSPSTLIAADVNGASVPSGFARVEAFRDGFYAANIATCTSKYSA